MTRIDDLLRFHARKLRRPALGLGLISLLLAGGCGSHPATDPGAPIDDGGNPPPPPADPDPGAVAPAADPAARLHTFYQIRVVDAASQVPLAGVQLRTTTQVLYTSDQNGVVAFYEPGLMDTDVYFSVSRPGYEITADLFGNRGKALHPVEGGSGEIAMNYLADTAVPAPGDLQSRLLQHPVPGPKESCAIRVVDPANHRGVPLVFLSGAGEQYVTDSQGYVAYGNPDHLGAPLTLTVSSHGYELPGGTVTFTPRAGETYEIAMSRLDVAERLYRITGQGIFRDSLLLGLQAPTEHPAINGLVTGQDTVAAVPYLGQLFWIWGDTDRPAYPLGNFNTSGARSLLPAQGGLDPRLGVNTTYFTGTDGFCRAMFEPIAPTSSPTWLGSLVTVPDATGRERLFGVFSKPNGDLSTHKLGLTRFDDDRALFTQTGVEYALTGAVAPGGQPVVVRHPDQSRIYYGTPLRVQATAEALLDPATYEVFSAMGTAGALEKGADGLPAYGWKTGVVDTTLDRLKTAGFGAAQCLEGHLQNVESGKGVAVAGAGMSWNEHRRRFARVVQEMGGSPSAFGEVWYAEGDTPLGPWVYARKVVTHTDYTFYNVWMHPHFQRQGGRMIFFEGTYTKSFAGSSWPLTPRYNYNQQMYRLDLDDPRVVLPVPIYDLGQGADFASKRGLDLGSPALAAAFFAPDRPGAGTLPLWWSGPSGSARHLVLGGTPLTAPICYGVDPTAASRPIGAVPLYDFASPDGHHAYGVDASAIPAGYTKAATPIAYVWPSPLRVKLPVADFLGNLVASAGPDQRLTETSAGAGVDAPLDASASRDLAGSITSYTWRAYGSAKTLATGAKPTLHLAAGLHCLELEITDANGGSAADTVIIDVQP